MQLKAEVCFFYVKTLSLKEVYTEMNIPSHLKTTIVWLATISPEVHNLVSILPSDLQADLSRKNHVTNHSGAP